MSRYELLGKCKLQRSLGLLVGAAVEAIVVQGRPLILMSDLFSYLVDIYSRIKQR